MNKVNNKIVNETLAAEAAVIGSMLISPEMIPMVTSILSPDDFGNASNKVYFETILAMSNKGVPIDAVAVRATLGDRLADVGGIEYLETLIGAVPTAANAEYYAGVVRDRSLRRQAMRAGSVLATNAMDTERDAIEIVASTQQDLSVIINKGNRRGQTLKELFAEAFQDLDLRRDGKAAGLLTGYRDYDEMTGGFQKGEVIIIAARPSMGKTAFALNIAQNIAVRGGSVLVFSLEMTALSLAERILSSVADIPMWQLRKGAIDKSQREALEKAGLKMSKTKLFISPEVSPTPSAMHAAARLTQQQHGLDLVVIDYLQLINIKTRKENRNNEIGAISREIKSLANDLKCPVILVSQLSRASEMRADKKPVLADLRDSGNIEQDADVVMLLHREDYYHRWDAGRAKTFLADVSVAKNRNGPTDTFQLVFDEQTMTFRTHFKDTRNIENEAIY